MSRYHRFGYVQRFEKILERTIAEYKDEADFAGAWLRPDKPKRNSTICKLKKGDNPY
ncbi:MAG: hypothetical protein ACOCVA_06475 [Prolixibacteraceae bacterium]